MGAWGEGLYDSDVALDTLDDLFRTMDPMERPAQLGAVIGVMAQFFESELVCALEEEEDWTELLLSPPESAMLSERARATLKRIAESPEEALESGTRARLAEHTDLLGTYSDGPRFEELFSAPGTDAFIAEISETFMAHLDVIPTDEDLHDHSGDLAPLGLLLELGVRVEPSRLNEWFRRFEVLDAKTTEQRDFWDDYCSKVRRIFELLRT